MVNRDHRLLSPGPVPAARTESPVTMSSQQRVRAALDHRTPDRVPLDVGATDITGIHASTYRKLKRALGLPDTAPRVSDTFQMLAEIEEPVRKALGVDAVGLSLPYTVFGYRCENWKPFRMPDGTEVLVPGRFNTNRRPDGSHVQFPRGDSSCQPSGIMAEGGHYFDILPRQQPIDESALDARRWVEETYRLAGDEDLRELERRSRQLRDGTDYAVIADLNPAGFGGLVALMAPSVRQPSGIRDPEEFWMSYLVRRAHIEEIFGLQCELQMRNLELYRQALDDRIDVMIMSKTDFGAQAGPLIAPELYRALFKPLHARMNRWVHDHTSWKTFFHTCGDVTGLLDDFVEAGLDVLNPVQISAPRMDPRHLKDSYGDRLAFWGGGVSTQTTLPFGSPAQVAEEVARTTTVFGRGGGFVFATDQNIQPSVPVENILAVGKSFGTAREQAARAAEQRVGGKIGCMPERDTYQRRRA